MRPKAERVSRLKKLRCMSKIWGRGVPIFGGENVTSKKHLPQWGVRKEISLRWAKLKKFKMVPWKLDLSSFPDSQGQWFRGHFQMFSPMSPALKVPKSLTPWLASFFFCLMDSSISVQWRYRSLCQNSANHTSRVITNRSTTTQIIAHHSSNFHPNPFFWNYLSAREIQLSCCQKYMHWCNPNSFGVFLQRLLGLFLFHPSLIHRSLITKHSEPILQGPSDSADKCTKIQKFQDFFVNLHVRFLGKFH